MTIDAHGPTDSHRARNKLGRELQVQDAIQMVKDKHLIEDHPEHKELAENVFKRVLNKTYRIAGNMNFTNNGRDPTREAVSCAEVLGDDELEMFAAGIAEKTMEKLLEREESNKITQQQEEPLPISLPRN